MAEARALKKQSKEAIHVLIYAAELVNTLYEILLKTHFSIYNKTFLIIKDSH